MSRFNSLLDQIKGPEVKVVLGVLQAAKSKTLKVSLSSHCQVCNNPFSVLSGGTTSADVFTMWDVVAICGVVGQW